VTTPASAALVASLGQVRYGVSAELQRLLEQHDGLSRSGPTRTIGVIEHDANDRDHDKNGSGELH
jgi:hypothetical protein